MGLQTPSKNVTRESSPPPGRRGIGHLIPWMLGVGAGMLVIAMVVMKNRQSAQETAAANVPAPQSQETPVRQPAPESTARATKEEPSASSAAPSARAKPRPALESLKGQWARTDGQYLLDLRKVTSGGTVEAAYFNPGPIHVEKASARKAGDELRVDVELRDVNYPGCTYQLIYDAENDALVGRYYQAAMGEQFDVAFMRVSN